MEKLQFLKDWYEREDDRRFTLENSLNIPIAILTAVFATQFFTLTEFSIETATNTEKVVFIISITTSMVTTLVTIFFLFKSYHNMFTGFKYTSLPLPSDLMNYEKELIEYYRQNSQYYGGVKGEDKFEEYVIDRLVENASRNAKNNDVRSLYLYRSKGYMLASIITLAIGLVPFLTNYFSKPEEIQKIEIISSNTSKQDLSSEQEQEKRD